MSKKKICCITTVDVTQIAFVADAMYQFVDKGYEDVVMDAARNVGAGGGTVVKAGGTGMEIAKLFGMTISQEKEMVYIVSSRKDRDAIMRAIMDDAGAGTDAHGVIFSLPVDKVVGIRNLEN